MVRANLFVAAALMLLVDVSTVHARPPDPPAGYERTADGGAWVFRPAGEKDALVEIRLFAPVDAPRGGVALVKEWMAANPGGAAQEPTQPEPRVTAAIRESTAGGRKVQEAILALKLPSGQHQLEVVRLPPERVALTQSHLAAAGQLGKQLMSGERVDMPPSAAAPPAEVARDPRRLAGSIATVGFYNKTGIGVGGMVTFSPTPVVLFKSGDALWRIAALKEGDSVDALRAARPADWTRWRRAGGVLEIEKQGEWQKLDYQKTMDALPRGFKLDGRYGKLSGTGNVAMGGTSSVTVWSQLAFSRDGSFVSGGGASASARAGDTSTVAGGTTPERRGSYELDGYVLTLKHADGRVEHRLMVTDEKDPGVVWLDGDGYTRDGR